jgi:hypothetical protein
MNYKKKRKKKKTIGEGSGVQKNKTNMALFCA